MAKPSSGKQDTTKDRLPASAAARRRAEQSRQRQTSISRSPQKQRNKRKVQRQANHGLWYVLGVVVVAVAVVIGVFVYLGSRSTSNTPVPKPANPTVVSQITNMDPTILAQVGAGSSQVQNPFTPIKNGPPLVGSTGHPEILYEGAEYCPFCAAERWGMIVALSRFGTFHNLSQITSSSTDNYPNTATFSFYKSSYTSQYVDFVPLEVQAAQGVTLQVPTSAQQQILNTYNPSGSFPFVDIANKYMLSGASYDPQLLQNLDWQEIADALSNPNSTIAQGILGTANYLTAAICEATNQQPTSVCGAAPIPSIQKNLGSSPSSNNGSSQGMIPSTPVALIRPSWYG